MCDPLSIAGAAATVGGALMQGSAYNKSIGKRNDMLGAERARQAAYRAQATAAYDKTAAGFDKPAQDANLRDSQARRESALTASLSQAPGVIPTLRSAPKIVSSEIAGQFAKALAEGRATAKRIATAGAFGDAQFNNQLALSRSGSNIGSIADFARGSVNALPAELAATMPRPSAFGDILSGAGHLAGLAGITGAGDGLFDDWFRPKLVPGMGSPR